MTYCTDVVKVDYTEPDIRYDLAWGGGTNPYVGMNNFHSPFNNQKVRQAIAQGIDRDRILIKIASTWEGIRAAEVLEREGVDAVLLVAA